MPEENSAPRETALPGLPPLHTATHSLPAGEINGGAFRRVAAATAQRVLARRQCARLHAQRTRPAGWRERDCAARK